MPKYLENIKINGGWDDWDQQWRLPRIHRVIGYAQALADIDDNENFSQLIVSIDDYNGVLYVIWKLKPSEKEKQYLQKAWDSIVTNYESEPIEHEYQY